MDSAADGNNTAPTTTAPAVPPKRKHKNPFGVVVAPSPPPPTPPPSQSPTQSPASSPTSMPTRLPTRQPTTEPTQYPTQSPTDPRTYVPGDLTKYENGLALSTGLSSRLVARSGEPVKLTAASNGTAFDEEDTPTSAHSFHREPDAAAVFPHPDGWETHGWIYTSNSELSDGGGGVGSVFFDAEGRVTDYVRILRGTSRNCGGGATPWKTWISCGE